MSPQEQTLSSRSGRRSDPGDRGTAHRSVPRWARLATLAAGTWSVTYLALGIGWLLGAGGNPADPTVDDVSGLSLLVLAGPGGGAALLTVLAGLGVLLSGVLLRGASGARRPAGEPPSLRHRLPAVSAAALGLVLAVVLPDYRLLAAMAYTPILLVLTLVGAAPDEVTLWPWPVIDMGILTLAGFAWLASAVVLHRRSTGACLRCGRVDGHGDGERNR